MAPSLATFTINSGKKTMCLTLFRHLPNRAHLIILIKSLPVCSTVKLFWRYVETNKQSTLKCILSVIFFYKHLKLSEMSVPGHLITYVSLIDVPHHTLGGVTFLTSDMIVIPFSQNQTNACYKKQTTYAQHYFLAMTYTLNKKYSLFMLLFASLCLKAFKK